MGDCEEWKDIKKKFHSLETKCLAPFAHTYGPPGWNFHIIRSQGERWCWGRTPEGRPGRGKERERGESGMSSELRVKCLWDSAMLPMRGTIGVAGYDLSAANKCMILANGKGVVDTSLAVPLPLGTYAWIAL